jgi:hypothetical protein
MQVVNPNTREHPKKKRNREADPDQIMGDHYVWPFTTDDKKRRERVQRVQNIHHMPHDPEHKRKSGILERMIHIQGEKTIDRNERGMIAPWPKGRKPLKRMRRKNRDRMALGV